MLSIRCPSVTNWLLLLFIIVTFTTVQCYRYIHRCTHIGFFFEKNKHWKTNVLFPQTFSVVFALLFQISFCLCVCSCRVTVYIVTILFLFRSDGDAKHSQICHSVSFQSSAILQQCVCVFLNFVVVAVNFPSFIFTNCNNEWFLQTNKTPNQSKTSCSSHFFPLHLSH